MSLNAPTTVYRYNRAELLRILRLTARQLAAWEKAELVAAAESYSFFDLLQLRKLRELRDAIAARKLSAVAVDQLSMGMSHDFEVAIEEGSTCVRVGTAIFGERTKA